MSRACVVVGSVSERGLGCWLGMMLFRHKTKHTQFMVLVPLWTVVWAVGMALLVWYG